MFIETSAKTGYNVKQVDSLTKMRMTQPHLPSTAVSFTSFGFCLSLPRVLVAVLPRLTFTGVAWVLCCGLLLCFYFHPSLKFFSRTVP